MDLSTTQQIILIILASALAIFLILSIVIAVMIIRLIATLRLIANKAEHLIESAEHVGEIFKAATNPVGVFRFVQGLFDTMSKRKRTKDKE